MADILRVHDEFTGADGTLLSAHAPTVAGTGWTLEFYSLDDKRFSILNNAAHKAGGTNLQTRSIASAQPHPSGADQKVEAVLTAHGNSADDAWMLWLRGSSGDLHVGTGGTAYVVACYTGKTELWKLVAGVATQIGADAAAIAAGSVVTFSVVGSTLTVLDDGASLISQTDTAISQIGRWGIAAGNVVVNSDDFATQTFDNFKAWDVSGVTNFDPLTAPLRVSGIAPTAAASSTIAPAAGSTRATGLAPTVTATAVVAPSTGSLRATGVALAFAGAPSAAVFESGVFEDGIFEGGGVAVEALTRSLRISGTVAAVSATALVTPDAAATVLSGTAPTVNADALVTPTAAVLSIGGVAPTVTASADLAPIEAALLVQGVAPTPAGHHEAAPGASSLALASIVPDVAADSTVTPAAAALALSGQLAIVEATGSVFVSPLPTSLVSTGQAPTVSADAAIELATGALAVTGAVLDVAAHFIATPAATALRLPGVVPEPLADAEVAPTATELRLASFAPSISGGTDVATVELGAVEWLVRFEPPPVSQTVDTATGHLRLIGQRPTVLEQHTPYPIWINPQRRRVTVAPRRLIKVA